MIHRLSINMNYAVHWTADQMMRDFIQNFYDAAGEKNFHHQFQYHYSDGSLEMSSEGGFSKEWLLYFGASTKRNSHKTFAGKYGEGFKIAALVAIRDYGLGVRFADSAGQKCGDERTRRDFTSDIVRWSPDTARWAILTSMQWIMAS